MFIVRYHDKARGQWRRSRTKRGPRGLFKTRRGALRRLSLLRGRGLRSHMVELAPTYPNALRYSEHFSRVELDCKCGCRTPPGIERELAKLARDLETLRLDIGSLGVRSGYRCAAYNKVVGGASKSQHMSGKAADLVVPSGKQDRYVAAAKRIPSFNGGGIGVYPNGGVHVDRRGWVARWDSF